MALVAKVNGNPITPAAYNDFMNLLTGVMQDQTVKLVALLQVKSRGAAPGAPTGAIAAGGSVDLGAHDYAVTFVDQDGGETLAGTHVTVTATGGNQTVNLTAIPTGPTGTAKRKIYRSKAGTTSPLFLLSTLNDNSQTTLTDTSLDSTLPTTQPPTHPSFGGSTQWQDNTGAVKAQVFSDGAVSFDGGLLTSDGAGDITFGKTLRFGNVGAYINQDTTNHWIEFKSSASGAASGHIFSTWDGANVKIPFSVGGQFASAPAWVDNSGNLTANQVNWGAGASGSLSHASYSSANHENEYQTPIAGGTAQGHLFITWNGSASVFPFSIGATGVVALSGVDNSGHFNDNGKNVPFINPTGASTAGRQIFTGTTTPTGANEGDIWISA